MEIGNRTERGGRTERLPVGRRHLYERCYATIWLFQYRSREVSDLFDIEGTNTTCNDAYGTVYHPHRSMFGAQLYHSLLRGPPKDDAFEPSLQC